jgi:hypothetical protein
MTNDEAKFLLNAYRPGGADATDPSLAAALTQARNDPALAEWFAREQAHATAVARKLGELRPPPGLREAILAGGRATERATPRASRRPMATWLAIAASVALMLGVGAALWPTRGIANDDLTAFALEDVRHGRHGGHGEPAHVLQTELGDTNTHLATGLPLDFAALENSGCRTLTVAGHDVLEVCFLRGGVEYHCYICRAGDVHALSAGATSFVQQAGLAAAAWSKGAYHFVVVTDAGLDAVKRLL